MSGVHARLLALFAITGCDVGAEEYATGLEQLGEAAAIARAANDEIAYGEVVSATAHLHCTPMPAGAWTRSSFSSASGRISPRPDA